MYVIKFKNRKLLPRRFMFFESAERHRSKMIKELMFVRSKRPDSELCAQALRQLMGSRIEQEFGVKVFTEPSDT